MTTHTAPAATTDMVEYLGLGGQIASAYIGGPGGWIDWNGYVGGTDRNIGKWPTGVEVRDELRSIAEAFPFLSLRVQLVPDAYPYGADDTVPAVEWQIREGVVLRVEPVGAEIIGPMTPSVESQTLSLISAMRSGGVGIRERGVALDVLRAAYENVLSKVAT